MSNLSINTSTVLDSQLQLQQLLEQQAAISEQEAVIHARRQSIQAQIDALSATSPQTYHRSPIHKQHQHRRRDVPRSMSTHNTATMSRQLSSDRAEAAAISRSLSQRSATSMTRTSSRGSATQRSGNNPFASTTNNPVRQLALPLDIPQEQTALADWTTREQPFSPYTPSHHSQSMQRSISQHKSGLQRVPEHGRILEDLQDPSEYLSRQLGTPILSISPAEPLPSSTFPSHRSSLGAFDFPTPSTPSTGPLTHGTTVDNNTMSRSTSLFNENFEMMRINSNASYADISPVEATFDQGIPPFSSSYTVSHSSNEEQAQLLAGAGGVSNGSQLSHSFPTDFATSKSFTTYMEKSESNGSSSSSLSSRNRLRLKLQNQHAARTIQPKGGNHNMARTNSSGAMFRLDSKDGTQDKVAISKPTYQRPKHERVLCKQCDAHPEGFRGEHELRRHQDREHKQLVKKWIVVEPMGEGRTQPIVPLSKCKACGTLKKTYGAYYNVAAHLRRTHFKPKNSKSRNKARKEPEERRGGKGGGDWPPMSELKHWMKEVEVPGVEQEVSNAQQNDYDSSDDEPNSAKNELQFVDFSNYQNDYSKEETPFAYKTNAIDTCDNIQGFDSQQKYMDQSMYCYSSQDAFSSFPHVFQSDPLALLTGSHSEGHFVDYDFASSSF